MAEEKIVYGSCHLSPTDGAKNMIATSFTALPSWVTNSDDVATH